MAELLRSPIENSALMACPQRQVATALQKKTAFFRFDIDVNVNVSIFPVAILTGSKGQRL
jgi:hypothetical protein